MKLFKHMEMLLMLAFFLVCAIGALQIGAPGKPALTTTSVNPAIPSVGGHSMAPASMALPILVTAPITAPMTAPMIAPKTAPMTAPMLMPATPPMPVVHIIGRRMTSAEKRAAAASAG